jgi:uncharacterized CHY-type Zn-finger protein
LLYLPFNYDKDYAERTIPSFEGSANLSRIDVINLKLTFDTPINNVKIYNLQSNIYRQMAGMGGTAYRPVLSNDTIDLQIQQTTRTPQTTATPQRVGTSITYGEPVNKPILITDASNCPIICEVIAVGERYMSCHQCNNNFSEQALKQWLESKRVNQRTCPLCRVRWSNFDIYINANI